MSGLRALKRKVKKTNGELVHKKVVASKLGLTTKEYNAKMKKRERNLQEVE
jgi:hypothetical protein